MCPKCKAELSNPSGSADAASLCPACGVCSAQNQSQQVGGIARASIFLSSIGWGLFVVVVAIAIGLIAMSTDMRFAIFGIPLGVLVGAIVATAKAEFPGTKSGTPQSHRGVLFTLAVFAVSLGVNAGIAWIAFTILHIPTKIC